MLDTSDFVDDLNRIGESAHDIYPCLLTDNGRQALAEFLDKLKRQDPLFSRCVLTDWLKSVDYPSRQTVPPLELIWKLNEEEFLFVTTYFYVKKDYVQELIDSFKAVYQLSRDDSVQEAVGVICNVIVVIINTLKHYNDDLKMFYHNICLRISAQAIELMTSGSLKYCYLTDLTNSIFLFEACFAEFVLIGLKQFLMKSTKVVDYHFALKNHHKLWSAGVIHESKKQFLEKVVSVLLDEVILQEFHICAQVQPFNFDHLMPLLTVLAVAKPEAMASVKDTVNRWLTEGDPRMIRIGLLVARHCCSEKAKFFKSYVTWLDTLPWKSIEFVSAFYSVLTDLVPNEPPLYLKIHVKKVPSTQNHSIVADYVNLAKTRLSDMNESTNYICIFGDYYETDAEGQNSDVSRVIAHFKEKQEIAKPVLEASVFSKHYYETGFLKQLLKVPEKQDPIRATVINNLYSMGKDGSVNNNIKVKVDINTKGRVEQILFKCKQSPFIKAFNTVESIINSLQPVREKCSARVSCSC